MLASRQLAQAGRHVTVVGGGLSGLTAAYRLARLKHRVTLIESSDRLGGWVNSPKRSVQLGQEKVDVVLEKGPRSIRPKGSKGAAQMLQLVSLQNLYIHTVIQAS